MSKNISITVAHGDGIGPEIMDATLEILKGASTRLDIETIEIGENVYLRGFDFIKTENFCNFDGQRGYSLDQGA